MDLRNWEFFTTGAAVSSANVYVYEADLAHPNPNAVLDSTTTNASGMWSFTGLSDTPKDVKVEYSSRVKWYKGLTQHSVYAVRENAEDAHLEQNWVQNGGFEVNTTASSFTPGTTDADILDRWTSRRGSGDTLTIDRVTSPVPTTSAYALRCVYTKSAGRGVVEQFLANSLVASLRGRAISLSAQVRQGTANAIRLFIYDGVNTTYSTASATTGSYITISIENFTVDNAATVVDIGFVIEESGTHYLDNVMLNVGTTAETFVPQFDDRLASQDIYLENDCILYGRTTTGTRKWVVGIWTDDRIYLGGDTSLPIEIFGSSLTFNNGSARTVWHSGNDGAGSTLDADLLDGVNSTSFARVDAATNFTTAPTISGGTVWHSGNDGAGSGLDADVLDGISSASFARVDAATNFTTAPTINSGTVWHSSNDGAGSGLDADVLDGAQGSQYARLDSASNFTTAPTINGGTVWHSGNDGAGSGLDADLLDGVSSASFARVDAATNFTTAPTIGGATVWTSANDGAGSGLDADTLDSLSSTGFVKTGNQGTNLQSVVFDWVGSNDGIFAVGKNAGDLYGGAFAGLDGVLIKGDLGVVGGKTRIAKGKDGTYGFFHALESPEPYFEEFGHAEGWGNVRVDIPEDFLNYVDTDDYFITLTPYGENPVSVIAKDRLGFTVRALGHDTRLAKFDWRVTARQGDLPRTRRLTRPA